ncbi:MAG: hypothetical protein HYZ42_12755 [Bacteroidetes bacterium]|nr:hypothetical protein [Bacteroidota bacterium]
MKKLFTLLIVLTLIRLNSQSQDLKFYPTQPQLFGSAIKMPFVGGFQTAFAQPIDLNNDGLKDLIIFDKSDRKILTFIDTSKTNHGYMYDPKYEAYINFISSWFLVRDYDRDGRDDFFVGANGNVSLYRNVSKGPIPEFVLQYEILTDTTDIIPGLKSNIYVDQVNIPAFEDLMEMVT